MCEIKELKIWALDPFAKIKINEELKLKFKRKCFLVFLCFLCLIEKELVFKLLRKC